MGKHSLGNEIKWYRPFALIKRNKELEDLIVEQFNIIDDYKDELEEKKQIILILQNQVASLKEDNASLMEENLKLSTKKTTRKTAAKKETKKVEKKTTTKKAATKKETKKTTTQTTKKKEEK